MLSRHHAFRIGSALIVIAGIGWFAATPRAKIANSSTLQPPASTTSSAQSAATATDSASAFSTSSALLAIETEAPSTKSIRDLLDQQRRLGPAEREAEDEIRRALLSLLSDENAANILQALSPDDLHSEFGVAALARWTSTDALAATLWLAQQPTQSAEQTWVIAQAIIQDEDVLAVLCARLPTGPWREALLAGASHASLPENPRGAIQLAHHLQPGTARTRALLTIADDWTLRDPAAAARWIASEPDLPLRDELIFAAAAAQASTDPVGALTGTFSISTAGAFERALGKITTQWADYEPARANHFAALAGSPDRRTIHPESNLNP